MGEPISIVVVDDHPIFRSGLVQVLSLDPGLTVLAQGGSGAEAVTLVAEHQPDLLLLDVTMKESGIDAIAAIRAASANTRIVMLTASEEETDVSRALDGGAVGYVLKGTTGSTLIMILREIHAGEIHISQRVMGRLVSAHRQVSPQQASTARLSSLSRQEAKVLRLLAQGLNNREIGTALGVQEKTVKFHLSNVFDKLKVRNRVEASLLATRGWPDMGPDNGPGPAGRN